MDESVLKGNYEKIVKPDRDYSQREETEVEKFEREATAKIGGSIAFVTKLKDGKPAPMFWDGD